jgi:hypothetical protein
MIRFFIAMVIGFVCVTAQAQHNAKSGKWGRVNDPYNHEYVTAATAAIHELMEQNFQACSAENLKGVMETMTSNCPDRERFMQECQQMFDDTDVYIRLVDCKWITSWQDSKGLWAAVNIKQWTVPKDDNVDYTEYRHRSGLLPKWELCEYQLFARVENGQWKAHVINGGMYETQWPQDGGMQRQPVKNVQPASTPRKSGKAAAKVAEPVKREDCPDGTCPNQWPATPHVRPKMTTLQR